MTAQIAQREAAVRQIEVDLPRPRPLDMRLGLDFAALKRKVWIELGLGEDQE